MAGGKEYDYMFKLIFIGDSNVGKTELLFQLSNSSYSEVTSTIGVDFKTRMVTLLNGKTIKLQMWDTAGAERFRTITTAYYRGTSGIFLVYDITNEESFLNISNWLSQINQYAPESCITMLLGNNCHKTEERKISKEKGEEAARENGFLFFEVSIKENINMEESVLRMTEEILKKVG